MPLWLRYAPMASYDLSSMLFPMVVCLLVLGTTPPGAPCGADGACGKAAALGRKRSADGSEFSEGRPVPGVKVFAALALERPWSSLRSQGETGWGVRGGCPWDFGKEIATRCCVSGRNWVPGGGAVHWLTAVCLAGRRSALVDAVRCAEVMPMRCPGASCLRGVPSAIHGGPASP